MRQTDRRLRTGGGGRKREATATQLELTSENTVYCAAMAPVVGVRRMIAISTSFQLWIFAAAAGGGGAGDDTGVPRPAGSGAGGGW